MANPDANKEMTLLQQEKVDIANRWAAVGKEQQQITGRRFETTLPGQIARFTGEVVETRGYAGVVPTLLKKIEGVFHRKAVNNAADFRKRMSAYLIATDEPPMDLDENNVPIPWEEAQAQKEAQRVAATKADYNSDPLTSPIVDQIAARESAKNRTSKTHQAAYGTVTVANPTPSTELPTPTRFRLSRLDEIREEIKADQKR